MTDHDDFWAPRFCLLPPIPELHRAADDLDQAADALLAGDLERARACVRRADDPAVKAFALSLMGKEVPFILRLRDVSRATVGGKADRRMPSAAQGAAIYRRDGWRCRYCGVRVLNPKARGAMARKLPDAISWTSVAKTCHGAFLALNATLDHVVPHSAGGTNDADNVVTTCWPCNFGRAAYLLEELGLLDPRTRAPTVDAWDGLSRIVASDVKQAHDVLRAKPATAAPPQPKVKRSRSSEASFPEAEWFRAFKAHDAALCDRLLVFLQECLPLPVNWRAKRVLLIRMEAAGEALEILGIEPNGDVQVPWFIGPHKEAFRNFAVRVAAAIPGAVAYETPKTWSVRGEGRRPLRLDELLTASSAVREAIADLAARLGIGGA